MSGQPGPQGPTGPTGLTGPKGDTGEPGFVNMKQVEIDFGEIPMYESLFVVEDEDAQPFSMVMAQIAMEPADDKELDEITMDGIEIKAYATDGQVNLQVRGLDGYLHGKFVVNYVVH